jgi:[pyruvate, water dikinase]-phosphate phosphotransferase / [pyruvate, water dikinase] kinase
MQRTAFFISDGTGITAETLGEALLAQFEGVHFEFVRLPYVDTDERARLAVEQIDAAAERDGRRPIVFDTVIDQRLRQILASAKASMFDIFTTFLAPLEQAIGAQSSFTVGRFHGPNSSTYHARIDAVHYAMANDDGATGSDYQNSDVILIGVSRSGKTPSCIYLAMQFGVHAANYPITDDDLESDRLPPALGRFQERLFGLTIDPARLAEIRNERRPGSRYASLRQCEDEVRHVEALLRRHHIPSLDTTRVSVEEIATRIMMEKGLRGRKGQSVSPGDAAPPRRA